MVPSRAVFGDLEQSFFVLPELLYTASLVVYIEYQSGGQDRHQDQKGQYCSGNQHSVTSRVFVKPVFSFRLSSGVRSAINRFSSSGTANGVDAETKVRMVERRQRGSVVSFKYIKRYTP